MSIVLQTPHIIPNEKMDRNNGVDLFKLIGAFFVVCLHTSYGNLDQSYVNYIQLIARWAVPFFFMATGFFLGHKTYDNTLDFKKINHNISGLISILIICSVLYSFVNIYTGNCRIDISILSIGTFIHLWFVGSLLFGYMFIWYMFFINRAALLPYISLALLMMALISDSYDLFFTTDLDFGFFRFLLSIPFLYIGMRLSKIKQTFNNKLLILLAITGFFMQIIEAKLFASALNIDFTHQFLIGTPIASISLFLFSLRLRINENKLSRWGREHSLFIYLYHPLAVLAVWNISKLVLPKYLGTIGSFSPLICFILTITGSIIISARFPKIFRLLTGKWQQKKMNSIV